MHELIRCPYCLAHYFSLIFVLLYDVTLIEAWTPLDYIVSAFAVAGVASITAVVIHLGLLLPQILVSKERDGQVDETRTTESIDRGG